MNVCDNASVHNVLKEEFYVCVYSGSEGGYSFDSLICVLISPTGNIGILVSHSQHDHSLQWTEHKHSQKKQTAEKEG